MLKNIIERVFGAMTSSDGGSDDDEQREDAIHLATAVLMADVARADNEFDEQEFDRVLTLMRSHFHLSADDALQIANSADERAEELVSLTEFTHFLHENLDEAEKAKIVSLLWKVAYADGRLDKYEDALVLKISDLLYVSRGTVMRLKHDADPGEDQR